MGTLAPSGVFERLHLRAYPVFISKVVGRDAGDSLPNDEMDH